MQNDTSLDSPVQIPLSDGSITIVSQKDSDLSEYRWHRWGRGRYVCRSIETAEGEKTIFMHRVILERVLEIVLSKDELVDHRDHDILNNQRYNLRLASRVQNGQNRKINANNKSGYKGVSYYKSRGLWRAAIYINGKSKTLGYFPSPLEAARRYNEAAREHFGEFALLNPIEE